MEAFVKRMIDEHKMLVLRINDLNDFVYSEKSDNIHKAEFANMCIQLKAMRVYEEALRARLVNHGVVFESDTYYQPVDATYIPPKGYCEECSDTPVAHSDFDEDTERINEENK